MQVVTGSEERPRPPGGTVVTIGVFDGVHRGHQFVLDQVRRRAAELGAASAVVTFDRHPATVVRPATAPLLLTDLAQRLELLDALGIDVALVIPFDEARAREPAEAFVTGVLVGRLGARAVVVGADFHFGHRRRGDVALLMAMGAAHGFEVHGLDLVPGGAGGISSTAIRSALARGDLETATELLGRPHQVRGVVVRGDARGRRLGYPTANVAVPAEVCLPGDGIYAGWYARPDGTDHRAAISLGRRPTFHPDASASVLEAHLLDFAGDLVGEAARVRFVARLRDEERYDTVEELVAQTGRDVEAARAALDRSAALG
ncbi:MAG: bifunctional riboflavin kinase/FAD synthetase [Acidimicrobiales bacterium]